MCIPGEEFKLCSCKDDSDFKVLGPTGGFWYRQKPAFVWTLQRRIEGKTSSVDGFFVSPKVQLKDRLTSDFVCWQLNSRNCFDFDYEAANGDTLVIRDVQSKLSYMAFSFKDGYWLKSMALNFDIVETIDEGSVTYHHLELNKQMQQQMQSVLAKLPSLTLKSLPKKNLTVNKFDKYLRKLDNKDSSPNE